MAMQKAALSMGHSPTCFTAATAELQNQPKAKSVGSTGPAFCDLALTPNPWPMLRLSQAHVVPVHTLTLIAFKSL